MASKWKTGECFRKRECPTETEILGVSDGAGWQSDVCGVVRRVDDEALRMGTRKDSCKVGKDRTRFQLSIRRWVHR